VKDVGTDFYEFVILTRTIQEIIKLARSTAFFTSTKLLANGRLDFLKKQKLCRFTDYVKLNTTLTARNLGTGF